MTEPIPESAAPAPRDFIRDVVAQDIAGKRYRQIVTRFPPEPNGYLHIGHAKSICLNLGIARENGGRCNLRLDDTNPAREEGEYVEAIVADVKWLIEGWADGYLSLKPKGATPAASAEGAADYYLGPASPETAETEPFFASDYFGPLYDYARRLIEKGKAFVCDLSAKEIDEYRGPPDKPGRDSPFRNRTVAENLDLFAGMKAGEYPDGARTLRAKIDNASPNIWLRDPLLYRIRHASHHHTGDAWRIYPLYDFAHCLSDYLEGVTHSLCTIEFEVHRPLYNWILEALDLPRPLPRQYEFAKLNLSYMMFSKRRLLQMVQEKLVAGWDDPRLPTIAGVRRRGIPASALRRLAATVGVTKFESVTDLALFEHIVREELNPVAIRRLAVLHPVKVVLTNLAADEVIECDATDNPKDEHPTIRKLSLTREVWIEADDFAEVPPPKYFRLRPGGEVRLKYGCLITCQEAVKDSAGRIVELRCTADLDSRAGGPNAGKKVKGTIHWVSVSRGFEAEVRLYDRLFSVAEPDAAGDFKPQLNPHSLAVVRAKLEPSLQAATAGRRYQFERLGYFTLDPLDSRPTAPVFNRTITLKDAWANPAAVPK